MKPIVKGFIDTLLWAEADDHGVPFDERSDVQGIAPECLKRIEAGCAAFEKLVGAFAEKRGEWPVCKAHEVLTDSTQGGHDLYLTAAGHGAGFWDGDWTFGDELTQMAKEACGWIEHVAFFVNEAGQVEF